MRRPWLIVALLGLSAPGCATVCETLFETAFDGVVDAIFGPSTSRIDDDQERSLRRKGIEPGGKEHRRLVWEEEMWQDAHRESSAE